MANALAVVAHYDDHAIFMGGTIRRLGLKRWNWTLVTMCIDEGDRHLHEKRDYFARFGNQFGAEAIATTFEDRQGGDLFSGKNSRDAMRNELMSRLNTRTFDWVFTHSREPNGEYGGHRNHTEVQQIVSSLVEEGRLVRDKGCLAYFSYHRAHGFIGAVRRDREDALPSAHV